MTTAPFASIRLFQDLDVRCLGEGRDGIDALPIIKKQFDEEVHQSKGMLSAIFNLFKKMFSLGNVYVKVSSSGKMQYYKVNVRSAEQFFKRHQKVLQNTQISEPFSRNSISTLITKSYNRPAEDLQELHLIRDYRLLMASQETIDYVKALAGNVPVPKRDAQDAAIFQFMKNTVCKSLGEAFPLSISFDNLKKCIAIKCFSSIKDIKNRYSNILQSQILYTKNQLDPSQQFTIEKSTLLDLLPDSSTEQSQFLKEFVRQIDTALQSLHPSLRKHFNREKLLRGDRDELLDLSLILFFKDNELYVSKKILQTHDGEKILTQLHSLGYIYEGIKKSFTEAKKESFAEKQKQQQQIEQYVSQHLKEITDKKQSFDRMEFGKIFDQVKIRLSKITDPNLLPFLPIIIRLLEPDPARRMTDEQLEIAIRPFLPLKS
jgi:hypothetical protein